MNEPPRRRFSWFDDFGDDSLDIAELVMELKEEFDIDIPDDDAEKIRTVADAIRYLEDRRGGSAPKM